MTIQLAPEAEAVLNQIATSSGLPPEQELTAIILQHKAWLDYESAEVAKARASIARGEGIDHDVLFNRLRHKYSV